MATIKTTTIEQSDKLVELGIDSNTADLSYVMEPVVVDGKVHYLDEYQLSVMNYPSAKEIFDKYLSQHKPFAGVKPAWSLTALLDIIPGKVFDKEIGSGGLIMYKTMNNDRYRFAYHGIYTSNFHENQIEAAIEVLEWLFTNGYLKKDKNTNEDRD